MKSFAGKRVGRVAFAPLRSETGAVVPISFGALWTRIGGTSGLTVVLKATFSLTSSPMKAIDADAIRPADLVPRKPLVDVLVSSGAIAHAADVRFAVVQRGAAMVDIRRAATPGASASLDGRSPAVTSAIKDDGRGGPLLELKAEPALDTYQCAPSEQRAPLVDPDARVIVAGLLHGRGTVEAQLPSARAAGTIFGVDRRVPGQPMVLSFKIDTVMLHPDRVSVSLLWRAEVALVGEVDPSEMTVAAGVATHEHPIRMRRRLEDLEIERPVAPAPRRDATVVLDEKAQLEIAPTEMLKAPVVDTPGAGIRAWAAETSAASNRAKKRDETVVASSPPSNEAGGIPFKATSAAGSAGKLRAWAGLGSADRTEIPDSGAPVSLPFDRNRPAQPPSASKPASTRARGDTVIGARKSADKTIPFATDRDREEALAKKREADAKVAAEREAEAARKADAAERERKERAAEEEREAERRAFAAEQARLARVEAERKELAAQRARADARKVEEALYGGLRKKPKKGP